MKKIAVILTVLVVSQLAQAQNSQLRIGGGLAFASDISGAGLFIKGNYAITNEWEFSGDFTYFFPRNYGYDVKYNWMTLNANAHYVFFNENEFSAYGLGGLSILMEHIDGYNNGYGYKSKGGTDTYIGINLGAGGRYALTNKLSLLGELKLVLGSGTYLQLNAGVLYRL